jgi:hypothetical protein
MTTKWQAVKDPDEVKDFGLVWADLLLTDTIDGSSWIVPDGITKDSDVFTDDSTTIWLSGGTDGETYRLTNRVTTAGGRTYDETCVLKCKTK